MSGNWKPSGKILHESMRDLRWLRSFVFFAVLTLIGLVALDYIEDYACGGADCFYVPGSLIVFLAIIGLVIVVAFRQAPRRDLIVRLGALVLFAVVMWIGLTALHRVEDFACRAVDCFYIRGTFAVLYLPVGLAAGGTVAIVYFFFLPRKT
jgi:hypothetical protein